MWLISHVIIVTWPTDHVINQNAQHKDAQPIRGAQPIRNAQFHHHQPIKLKSSCCWKLPSNSINWCFHRDFCRDFSIRPTAQSIQLNFKLDQGQRYKRREVEGRKCVCPLVPPLKESVCVLLLPHLREVCLWKFNCYYSHPKGLLGVFLLVL